MKQCRICKQTKPLSDFTKNSKARSHQGDGYENRCKECRNAYNKTPERRKASNLSKKLFLLKPENLAKQKEGHRRYAKTDHGKKIIAKARAKYKKTQKGKATIFKINKKHRQTQKYKDTVKNYQLKFPEKRKARTAITNAIAYGKIIRPDSCSICNKKCIPEGHHPDYSKPLEVIWVCHDCHVAIHWHP